jgi:uncharacterized phiE125 gp8 family phage protein
MGLQVVVLAVEKLVSVPEAKLHLRVEHSEEDGYIFGLIETATRYCEQINGRAFLQRTFELTLDAWPEPVLRLPYPPLRRVEEIAFTCADGSVGVVDGAAYYVDVSQEPGRVCLLGSWPQVVLRPFAGVRIRYVAGFLNAAVVPKGYRQAALLMIGHWYEHRENVSDRSLFKVPSAARSLLEVDRVKRF